MIQTPGLSQFFGCRPLGPVGLSVALGSAGAAGLLGLVLGPVITGRADPGAAE